ncbi:MAG: hypothetical protein PGN23_13070 [Sphingomonas adhaesiva]|uniref:hypothetical protein n=1 Tax=Sphingomonas adhaesiva TaxID=28212 RepID=UPI002FFC9F7C
MSNGPETPVRSPSYPVWPLSEAITAVRKIEAQYRRSKVDREIAAKLIGYSGLSGPANKALAALAQFGLVERAGKGEMRVTDRARALLYTDDAEEKRQELQAAAFEPQLFRELQERWPNMIPPEDGVVMYLNRKGFNQSAVRPAAKAYRQTLLFIEEESASESHGEGVPAGPPTNEDQPQEQSMEQIPEAPPQRLMATMATASPGAFANTEPAGGLNKINMNIRGDKVHLEGLLDRAGLAALEKKIAALKELLDMTIEQVSAENQSFKASGDE